MSLRVTGAGAGNSVGPLDVWWTRAAGASDASEHHLGTAPRSLLTSDGAILPVTVDPEGVRTLVSHILSGDTHLRLRLEGPLDVGVGALPAAQLNVAVTLLLHVHGSL